MVSIGLGQALDIWFSGRKLDEYAVYGLPAIWWNRAAKFLAFLAGSTIILDAIGPKRFVEFSRTMKETAGRLTKITRLARTLAITLASLTACTSVVLVANGNFDSANFFMLVVMICCFFGLAFARQLYELQAKLIALMGRTKIVRRIVIGLFLSSFAIDMLTS